MFVSIDWFLASKIVKLLAFGHFSVISKMFSDTMEKLEQNQSGWATLSKLHFIHCTVVRFNKWVYSNFLFVPKNFLVFSCLPGLMNASEVSFTAVMDIPTHVDFPVLQYLYILQW